VPPLAPLGERGSDDAKHQREPDQQSEEQPRLPHAPEIEILPALMSPVEGRDIGKPSVDAQVLARERANDDDEERGEEHVHAEPLSLWLGAADERTDEETGSEPRGGDPEEPELQRPRPREAVRQPTGQGNAVEAIAFDAVVCDDGPGHDLNQEERDDDDEILHGGAL